MYLQHGSELCTFVFASISEHMRWCALGSRKHYERHVVEQFQLVSVHKSLDTTAARYNAKCSCGFFPLLLFLEHGDVGDEEHVHSVFPARTYRAHTEKCTDWTRKTKGSPLEAYTQQILRISVAVEGVFAWNLHTTLHAKMLPHHMSYDLATFFYDVLTNSQSSK